MQIIFLEDIQIRLVFQLLLHLNMVYDWANSYIWHSKTYSFGLFCIAYVWLYLFHATLTKCLLKYVTFCTFCQKNSWNHYIY